MTSNILTNSRIHAKDLHPWDQLKRSWKRIDYVKAHTTEDELSKQKKYLIM